jgi:hypothetical protein
MKIKRIMSEVKLVIADVEVELIGAMRSSPTLCALVANADGSPATVVPLNTPDGRPIFMKMENAIKQ